MPCSMNHNEFEPSHRDTSAAQAPGLRAHLGYVSSYVSNELIVANISPADIHTSVSIAVLMLS